jgi:hypothetical protein
MSSGALRFSVDTPLPADLVDRLIAVRIHQIRQGGKRSGASPS